MIDVEFFLDSTGYRMLSYDTILDVVVRAVATSKPWRFMQCPFCKEQRTRDKVIDSRLTEGGTVIRRRRECPSCKRRFTTYERVEEANKLLVIKKDGSRAPYQRDKLFAGLQRAS